MVELIPYFAGLIVVLFGIGFYAALVSFRKMADASEESTAKEEAAAAATARSGSGPDSPK